MMYGSFWQRLAASLVDFVIIILLALPFAWLRKYLLTRNVEFVVPVGLIAWLYSFLFHAYTGQTVGKRIARIRVVSLDGSPIGFVQSFRRGSVDLLFAIVIVVELAAIASLGPGEWESLDVHSQRERLKELNPSWEWVIIASRIWGWSEVVTMLFNRRRRALHDFLGGTVVVRC